MKKNKYLIKFSDGTEKYFYGWNLYQAGILGIACKIGDDADISIETIVDEKGNEYCIDQYMTFKKK